jgi:hypothetical protein
MPDLTFNSLPGGEFERERVDVPEFGTVDNEPYYVFVRGLTAYEWGQLMRLAYNLEDVSRENGQILTTRRADYDEICLVAAMCSADSKGRLIFGETVDDATEKVMNMPREYRPAFVRIHNVALELSGLKLGKDDSVEVAEKN